MNIPKEKVPRIVIIGGGFGGLKLALSINSKKSQIVLLDKNSYHTFQPLLYQVATAGLEADSIAYPIRKVFRNKKNFYFRLGNVERVDIATKTIHTDIGQLEYDYLIIATGSVTNFFGNSNLEENCISMKSLTEAMDIRSHILQNLEKALNTTDENEREALLNIVIVGGGPSGVELAGSIAELRKYILAKDYPDLNISRMKIHIVEGSPRVLNVMSDNSSSQAEKALLKMGIILHLNVQVKSYDGLHLDAGSLHLKTYTMIWAAGVKGAPIAGLLPDTIIGNRILVNEFNQVNGLDNVFAIGDVALQKTNEYPKGYPMLGSIAQQQGQTLGKNLHQLLNNAKMKPFIYKDRGTMATIGRNAAVVDLTFWKFSGLFAWFVWMFVHLMLLVSFRNRVVVFINWVWSYISYDKGTRLILPKFKKKKV
jgi:NADH dehydrogenase